MKIFTYFTYKEGGWAANCHLVIDEASGEAAIFDCSVSAEKIKSKLGGFGDHLRLKYMVLTHGHFDHMLKLDELRNTFPEAVLCIHADDAECLSDSDKSYFRHFAGEDRTFKSADMLLSDGDTLNLGDEKMTILHTPGHTRGSVCIMVESNIITGDTLFDGGIGRCDLYGGDMDELRRSLNKIVSFAAAEIGGECKLYPGHGGTGRLYKEIETNPFIKKQDKK